MKNKAIIIAVDTAMKPLSSHGISPHFVITIDPQEKKLQIFQKYSF